MIKLPVLQLSFNLPCQDTKKKAMQVRARPHVPHTCESPTPHAINFFLLPSMRSHHQIRMNTEDKTGMESRMSWIIQPFFFQFLPLLFLSARKSTCHIHSFLKVLSFNLLKTARDSRGQIPLRIRYRISHLWHLESFRIPAYNYWQPIYTRLILCQHRLRA